MLEENHIFPPGPPLDRNGVRTELILVGKRIKDSVVARNMLVRRGIDLGIGKTELAELAGVSRQTIYDILAKKSEEGQ